MPSGEGPGMTGRPSLRTVGTSSVRAAAAAAGREGIWGVTEDPGLSFAGLLRQLRAEANLTQEELAEVASLSTRSVSDLERDQPHRPQGHCCVAG
jgi:DNA-binding XRE family transcriptional regulator